MWDKMTFYNKKGNVAIGSGGLVIIFIIAIFLFIVPTQERQEVHIGIKLDSRSNPEIDYINIQSVKVPYIQLFEEKGAEGKYALKVEAHWILPVFEPISIEERINVGIGEHSIVIPEKPPVKEGSWLIKAEVYEFKNSNWVKVNEKETEIKLGKE